MGPSRRGTAVGGRWIAILGVLALVLGGALVPSVAGARQAETTLTFWDTQTAGVQLEVVEQLATEFEEAHPGVTVEHQGLPLEELQETLPRAMQSGEGPDVTQVNNGENLMGPMVRAKYLVPLTDYDAQYGWTTDLSPGLVARNRYTDDGVTFGEGTLWGVSNTAEIVGFYYNKQIFEDNGVAVPTTFEELEAAMQTFADAGVTPLVLGNLDVYQSIHLFGTVHATMTTREYLDGLIYRSGDQSWETDEIKAAATKLREWVEKGYLIDGFEGLATDDAWPLFGAGEGAMLLQGSWQAGDIQTALGENGGFFPVPPASDATVLHVGGVGIPYGITTSAEDQDLAAELVDFLVGDRAREVLLEKGQLPAGEIAAEEIVEGTVSGDVYTAWNTALANDQLGHYMDWATPTMYDTITDQLQQLLAGEATPEEFAAALQTDYADYLAGQ